MEKEVKDALLAEQGLLNSQPGGVSHKDLPNIHGMNLGSMNSQSAAGVAAERSALMGNMQSSMTAFNEAMSGEMGDEGEARKYVNDQEQAAFNEVNGAMGGIRTAADGALSGVQRE